MPNWPEARDALHQGKIVTAFDGDDYRIFAGRVEVRINGQGEWLWAYISANDRPRRESKYWSNWTIKETDHAD